MGWRGRGEGSRGKVTLSEQHALPVHSRPFDLNNTGFRPFFLRSFNPFLYLTSAYGMM